MFRSRRAGLCAVLGGLLILSAARAANTDTLSPVPGQAPSSEPTSTEPAVIVHFHLSGELTEMPQADPFGLFAGQVTSLKTLVERLEKARTDDKVKGVVLTFDLSFMGVAQMEEIRNELLRFREVKKPVYAQIDSSYLGMKDYALVSAASDVIVDPMADLWVTGLYAESPYAKGLLDKIGVGTDFLQFEQYKSAAEMLTRTEPSDAARENVNWLLDSLYQSLVGMIAGGRGLSEDQVKAFVDAGIHRAPETLDSRMVDAVVPREQFLQDLKARFGPAMRIDNRFGEEKQLTIDFTNPFAFFSLLSQMGASKQKPVQDTVAIVYVDGAILPGYGMPNPFVGSAGAFSGDIRHALQKAAQDRSVKAVVLRVDSPGGSALGSDIIFRATQEVKAAKPVVVSMGDLAASGGYFVSCGANEIFADETTLTGSIGVIGGKLITTGLWDKLGINWVGYPRGENADFFASARPFTDEQRTRFHEWMQSLYDVFKKRVTDGRGQRLKKPVEEIAGGRVYTGKQAQELGLVDRIGGLDAAIRRAAELASISEYETRILPEPKNPIEALIEALSGESREEPSDLEPPATSLGLSAQLSRLARVGADPGELRVLLPLVGSLEPDRAAALLTSLQRIELVHREGVILMMSMDLIIR